MTILSASVSEDIDMISTSSSPSDNDTNSKITDEKNVINTFVRCSRCNAAYSVDEAMLGPEGSRVKCEVCNHSWFQTPNRLQLLAEGFVLKPYPKEMLERVKENISNSRHPMDDDGPGKEAGMRIFVGNLPFSVDEEKLQSLFINYG